MYPGAYTPTTATAAQDRTVTSTATASSLPLTLLDEMLADFAEAVQEFKAEVANSKVRAAAAAALRRLVWNAPREPVLPVPQPIRCSHYLLPRPRCKLRRWRSLKERRAAWGRLTT